MDTLSVAPGALAAPYQLALDRLERSGFPSALWNRSLDIWTGGPDAHASIASRLGWLGAIDFIAQQLERLKAFADSVRTGGFTDVVLLGMGGSSLAPEVLRRVLGVAPGFPRFRMLDSIDPDAVRAAMEQAATSLFIFASKSGSTIEPNVMAAEARRRVLAAGHHRWGPRFVTITDEGTPAHQQALEEDFRDVFINPSDIGGRYSALSFFGMVPAAVMGADLDRMVARAHAMEASCRDSSVAVNPGLALGALIAAGAASGRDKLTLLLPARLRSFGLWVEQLVAESTGKAGVGVVPIAGEPLSTPLGDDRVGVAFALRDASDDESRLIQDAAGTVPSARIELPDAHALGAEFFRWQVATTAAGMLLGINPFDEPNVQQAKEATRTLLHAYSSQKRLPVPEAQASVEGARFTLSRAADQALDGQDARAFLRLLQRGDYFCLLAYLPPDDPPFEPVAGALTAGVGARTGCATMMGYGPRYLHSTGQLHKGGPNTGVFLILTADPASDLPIPGESFTFGVLEMAQALGDFHSLDDTGRRVLHIHAPDRDPDRLRRLAEALLGAL
jgi:glucose-6-phosphate isomerase/transaldolase/glucose-6-phosphate isomerase